jgi:hypothetical protein
MNNTPCDWDYESYCTADGCHNPATHQNLVAMMVDPIYEMVCCEHAIVNHQPSLKRD